MSIGLESSAIPIDRDLLPSILVLNDDCLLKILDNLDTVNLCAVSDTCQRFQRLSENCFRMQYNFKPFSFREPDTNNPSKVEKILKRFGKYINKLVIHSNETNKDMQQVLELIGIYCGQHLQEAELDRLCMDHIDRSAWERLLPNVKRLSIHCDRSFMLTLDRCIESCRSLKELEITNLSHTVLRFNIPEKWRTLESLILKGIRDHCFTLRYVLKNYNIKKLRLTNYNGTMKSIVGYILKYSKDIEEFAVHIFKFPDDFQSLLFRLSELEKLKRLEFNCGRQTIAPFIHLLAERNIMEYLSISCTELNEDLCEALSKMHSLKTLKLISMKNEYKKFTKILSKQLSQLERFYVVNSKVFTLTDAVEMIESLPSLKWLIVTDCRQFTSIGPIDLLRIVQARKRKYWNQLITIHLDKSVLNATIEEIPQQMHEDNSVYIKLMSTLRPEIKNDDFIIDYKQHWCEGHNSLAKPYMPNFLYILSGEDESDLSD